MRSLVRIVLAALTVLSAGWVSVGWTAEPARVISRIAFGSCMHTNVHPLLDRTLAQPFDLFVLLGDNIYADTTNSAVMAAKYKVRKEGAFFQALRKRGPVLATWDDHDYGRNDAGAEFSFKAQSQKHFLDFLDEPPDSPRRQREGIYDVRTFGPEGRRVQVILLDTRYFRSRFATGENNALPSGGTYIPSLDPNATMLGDTQWKWLEQQLKVPAEVRVIASSIQFLSEFSGAEAWANFPREKERMLQLIKSTGARGVIFISGDRHWAELSRLDRPGDYDLYDLTSSALTQWHLRGTPTPNRLRDGPTYHDANVGFIEIDWAGQRPRVSMRVMDAQGVTRIEKVIGF